MAGGDGHDRVVGWHAACDLLKRGLQDARVPCEEGLCHEDGADLLTGAACRLIG
jgi:hypothetical protein